MNPPKRMLPAQLVAWCYQQAGLEIGEDVAGFAEAMKAGTTPATERYAIQYLPFSPPKSLCFNVVGATLVQFLGEDGEGVKVLVRIR